MVNFMQLDIKFVLTFEILLCVLMLGTAAGDGVEEIEKALLDYYKCKMIILLFLYLRQCECKMRLRRGFYRFQMDPLGREEEK